MKRYYFECFLAVSITKNRGGNKQTKTANLKASYNQDETENVSVFHYAVPFPTNSTKLH